MLFDPITKLTSRTAILPIDNIDTDQIIPARFLKTTTRSGLGKSVFFDWRYDSHGRLRNNSPFNDIDISKQKILVAGSNFGCGSSREHAPWALLDFGFKVIISSDIADIFKSNALKNGLLPVEVDADLHKLLLMHPNMEVTVDLMSQTVTVNGQYGMHHGSFSIDPFARQCLIKGVDQLGALLAFLPEIKAFEADRAACTR